ncbi:MAG TPA: cupin domain-containing protein [Chitinophagaceae bacterium]|jgi:mannose-6-phosphate isomerase-like protein (cupin superfamily)|nr:cupin domain-containing protein [Chitinophagaceae bacterium]
MNRRLFLQFPLVAGALLAAPDAGARDPKKGFMVAANRDRYEEELLFMGGRFFCKVSGKDTEGQLCIYDTVRWEKGGPALHLHQQQDEWFYVVRGQFNIRIGTESFRMGPGDCAFVPRTVPHGFVNVSEGEAQMLVLFQPAGTIETFFKEAAAMGSSVPAGQRASAAQELARRHGMEILGPPLPLE